MQSSFLPQRGHYKSLIVYQKAECIYDVTYMFAHRFLSRGDRTVDQMIQAARSGKQNIAVAVRLRLLHARLKSSFIMSPRRASRSCWRTMRTFCVSEASASGNCLTLEAYAPERDALSTAIPLSIAIHCKIQARRLSQI